MKLRQLFLIVAAAAALTGAMLLLGTACSIHENTLAETIHEDAHTDDSIDDTLAVGKQLFIEKGCAACHGPNAQGTPGYPAVAGFPQSHTKEQVRNPHHRMPRFMPEQVSDEELDMITEYVESLVEPSLKIISPADGSIVSAGRVKVRVEVKYFELISDAYLPPLRNGIQHLIFYYMDVEIPVEKPKEHSHSKDHESDAHQPVSRTGIRVSPGIIMIWPDVEPGSHTIGVQLMDFGDRSPLDPQIIDQVTFTVR